MLHQAMAMTAPHRDEGRATGYHDRRQAATGLGAPDALIVARAVVLLPIARSVGPAHWGPVPARTARTNSNTYRAKRQQSGSGASSSIASKEDERCARTRSSSAWSRRSVRGAARSAVTGVRSRGAGGPPSCVPKLHPVPPFSPRPRADYLAHRIPPLLAR